MPTSSLVPVPPPVALAKAAPELTGREFADVVYEPKWDGFRGVWARGALWSRHGKNLTFAFPDLAGTLRSRLPGDVVLDGELVCWDTRSGALDFTALSRRLTAGRRVGVWAAAHPAHFVVFDVLATAAGDVRALPLRARRRELEQLLAGMGAPLALCQQSPDVEVARSWMATLTVAGIEGVVAKDAAARYPAVAGRRVWVKVKARHSVELAVVAVTGDPAAPDVLVLAAPVSAPAAPSGSPAGDGAAGGDRAAPGLRTVGATVRLPRAAAREVGRLIVPSGATVRRRFSWGADPVDAVAVEPFVVELDADVAVDGGVLRHPARLVRPRPDLAVGDLEPR